MGQRLLVINGKKLEYEGFFKVQELLGALKKEAATLGYSWHEKRFEEHVGESGKSLFIEFRPTKVKTSYYALMIKIRVQMENINEAVVEVKGMPENLQKGKITMLFDAWVTMLYAERWNMKPIYYFLKGMINKFIYRFPIGSRIEGEVASDTRSLYKKIKMLLGAYRDAGKS